MDLRPLPLLTWTTIVFAVLSALWLAIVETPRVRRERPHTVPSAAAFVLPSAPTSAGPNGRVVAKAVPPVATPVPATTSAR